MTGGTVLGSAGSNWPSCSPNRVQAVRLECLEKRSRASCTRRCTDRLPAWTHRDFGKPKLNQCRVGSRSKRRALRRSSSTGPESAMELLQVTSLLCQRQVSAEDKVNGEEQGPLAILRATLEGGKNRRRVISNFLKEKPLHHGKRVSPWVGIEATSVSSEGDFYVAMPGGWQRVWGGTASWDSGRPKHLHRALSHCRSCAKSLDV